MSSAIQLLVMFEETIHVGWAQVDLNAHMRNSAYLDVAVDVRLRNFAANGFPPEECSSRYARFRRRATPRRSAARSSAEAWRHAQEINHPCATRSVHVRRPRIIGTFARPS